MARRKKETPKATRDDGLGNARLDPNGAEVLDETPIMIPSGLTRPETLAEKVAHMLRGERMRMAAEAQGFETFDEAEDFDVDDDYDPHSQWENDFDVPLDELRRRAFQLREEIAERQNPKPEESPSTIVTPAPGGPPQPSSEGGGKA